VTVSIPKLRRDLPELDRAVAFWNGAYWLGPYVVVLVDHTRLMFAARYNGPEGSHLVDVRPGVGVDNQSNIAWEYVDDLPAKDVRAPKIDHAAATFGGIVRP
jgi:hypothetical protein